MIETTTATNTELPRIREITFERHGLTEYASWTDPEGRRHSKVMVPHVKEHCLKDKHGMIPEDWPLFKKAYDIWIVAHPRDEHHVHPTVEDGMKINELLKRGREEARSSKPVIHEVEVQGEVYLGPRGDAWVDIIRDGTNESWKVHELKREVEGNITAYPGMSSLVERLDGIAWKLRKDAKVQDSKDSQARKLVELGRQSGETEFFRNASRTAFARVNVGGFKKVLQVESSDFEEWLIGLAYDADGLAPGQTAIDQAIKTLAVESKRGEVRKVYIRHGTDGESFYYDLCNERGEAIKYNKNGWSIVKDPPVMFIQYSHMLPQVAPIRGAHGALDRLIGLANLPNEGTAILEIHTPTMCIPDIALMGAQTVGPQGTGKTTTQIVVSMLADPSSDVLSSLPHKHEDLGLYLSKHRIATFDNVSHLTDEQSDTLSRSATGAVDSGRALYTNNTVNRREYMAPTFMNGITITNAKPDLYDRLIVYLTRDAMNEPIPMNKLTELINELLPEALGEMFDILVKAMDFYEPELEGWRPRMAEWYAWAVAISKAKGYEDGWLEAHLKPLLDRRSYDSVAGDPVAVVLEWVAENGGFIGTAGDLFSYINDPELDIPFRAGIAHKGKTWPLSSDALGRSISRMFGPLKAHEVHIYRETWSKLGKFKDQFSGLHRADSRGLKPFGGSERIIAISNKALEVPVDLD